MTKWDVSIFSPKLAACLFLLLGSPIVAILFLWLPSHLYFSSASLQFFQVWGFELCQYCNVTSAITLHVSCHDKKLFLEILWNSLRFSTSLESLEWDWSGIGDEGHANTHTYISTSKNCTYIQAKNYKYNMRGIEPKNCSGKNVLSWYVDNSAHKLTQGTR